MLLHRTNRLTRDASGGGVTGQTDAGRQTVKTIMLSNDFHNRTVEVRVPNLPHTLSPSQAKRVRRKLCGHADCACGVVRGSQGRLDCRLSVYPDADRAGNATWTIERM